MKEVSLGEREKTPFVILKRGKHGRVNFAAGSDTDDRNGRSAFGKRVLTELCYVF